MTARRRRSVRWDPRRFARALAQPGMDLRHWLSYATVAAIDDDGEPNFSDQHAVLVTPAGVEVDVVLEPSGYPCTARFGISAGSVHINTPIHPGDQVVLGFPDGDVSMIPQVIAITNGSSDPMPVGDDGMPIFQNDRFMVHATVPIELRTADGTMVRITDQLVELAGQGVTEQAVLGTTQGDAEQTLNADPITGLIQQFNLLQAAAVGPLSAFKPGFLGAMQALQAYEQKRSGFLSAVVKLK